MSGIVIRPARAEDVEAVLRMGDEAVEWLVERGRSGQWGTQPWSTDPERVRSMTERLTTTEMSIAEIDGVPAGALAVARHPQPYAPPVDEPELYVHLLITAADYRGREVGATLLAYARDIAREWGVSLLRVDCYAGGGGDLVRYYERQGFHRIAEFEVKGWPGQVLEWRR